MNCEGPGRVYFGLLDYLGSDFLAGPLLVIGHHRV